MSQIASLKIFTIGGKISGYGHLARMIPIYDEFIEAGIKAKFFITGDEGVYGILEGRNAQLCDWMNDIPVTLNRADCLLVDTLTPPVEFIDTAKKVSDLVYFISDDIRTPEFPFSVINWRVGARTMQANNGLYGEHYVPLRKEVLRLVPDSKPYSRPALVVSMGAGDILNLIPLTLEILDQDIMDVFEVKVVIRSFHPQLEWIKSKYTDRLNLLIDLEARDLFKAMAGCDLAIASGGHSIYEFAYLGIPVIHVRTSTNQEPAKCWDNSGFTYPIGQYESETYTNLILDGINFFSDDSVRNAASWKGQELIDGRGAQRIREELMIHTA